YTLVKPVWIFSLVKGITILTEDEDPEKTSAENDAPLMLNNIPLFLAGSFLLIWPLTMAIGIFFHKRYSKNKIFFDRLKTFIIWIFFFHSLEIITFSYLEYKFIFTRYLDAMEKVQVQSSRLAN